jgi:hypothetical protein
LMISFCLYLGSKKCERGTGRRFSLSHHRRCKSRWATLVGRGSRPSRYLIYTSRTLPCSWVGEVVPVGILYILVEMFVQRSPRPVPPVDKDKVPGRRTVPPVTPLAHTYPRFTRFDSILVFASRASRALRFSVASCSGRLSRLSRALSKTARMCMAACRTRHLTIPESHDLSRDSCPPRLSRDAPCYATCHRVTPFLVDSPRLVYLGSAVPDVKQ